MNLEAKRMLFVSFIEAFRKSFIFKSVAVVIAFEYNERVSVVGGRKWTRINGFQMVKTIIFTALKLHKTGGCDTKTSLQYTNNGDNKENRDKNGSHLSAWNSIDNTLCSVAHIQREKQRHTAILLGLTCFPFNVYWALISNFRAQRHGMAQFFNLLQLRSNLFDFSEFPFSLGINRSTRTYGFDVLACRSKTQKIK